MKVLPLIALTLLAACGDSGSTDIKATRYNFAVVDGANQKAAAGSPALAKRITAQLTQDPQGKFATRVFDFLAPKLLHAQNSLPGDPVEGAIVCGREAGTGEPQVIPLCAFTLADGKAANVVQPGTKAGTFNILFTAQVPSSEPVKDSTSVTVEAGPMTSHRFVAGTEFNCWTVFPADYVKDQYANGVPYGFTTTGGIAHPASDVLGTEGARTLVSDVTDGLIHEGGVSVYTAAGEIAKGKLIVSNNGTCISLAF